MAKVELRSDEIVQRSFDRMLAEVTEPMLATQAMVEVLMKQSLIIMLRRDLVERETASPLMATLKDHKIARAVVAILEQPGASYSIDSLAKVTGMSRTIFADRFTQVFGQAPMAFVQRVRIRIVARLLVTTDLPIKVVANTIGYASRGAFSRVFEDSYGATPTAYRSEGGKAGRETCF